MMTGNKIDRNLQNNENNGKLKNIETSKWLIQPFKEVYIKIAICWKYLLITSLSGLSYVFLMVFLLERHGKLNIEDKKLSIGLVVIFVISLYILLVLPVFLKPKKLSIKIIGISISFFGSVTVYNGLFINKEYNIFYSIIFMVFLFFLFWIIIDLSKVVYKWIWIEKDDENTKQIDTARLNLLWLILAFILGLLFNTKK